jgi:hypothetical protein
MPFMNKIKVIGIPADSQEEFVKFAFISHADKLGFIISKTQVRFPDCTARDMWPEDKYNTYSKIVYVEFEYIAENFIAHGHDRQMQHGEHYIVVCWLDRGKNKLPTGVEVITLSNVIEAVSLPAFNSLAKPEVYVVPYNSKKNKGYLFTIFKSANIFRTNQKLGHQLQLPDGSLIRNLPDGSIIVIYEDKYLVGEFTVEHYEWIEQEPKTKVEKQIYELLSTVNYLPSSKQDPWAKGHIKYNNLFLYSPKVPFSVGLPNELMSSGGIKKIDFNKLKNIRDKTTMI